MKTLKFLTKALHVFILTAQIIVLLGIAITIWHKIFFFPNLGWIETGKQSVYWSIIVLVVSIALTSGLISLILGWRPILRTYETPINFNTNLLLAISCCLSCFSIVSMARPYDGIMLAIYAIITVASAIIIIAHRKELRYYHGLIWAFSVGIRMVSFNINSQLHIPHFNQYLAIAVLFLVLVIDAIRRQQI
jgi:hypothetical protein